LAWKISRLVAAGWTLAVDIGLGDRPETISSMPIRRFPSA
jgi:hypothetical protein